MESVVISRPKDRHVYGIQADDSKVLIGVITCVTPDEWLMYLSDARWKFISCCEGIPSSEAGTMEQVEGFVMALFAPVAKGQAIAA